MHSLFILLTFGLPMRLIMMEYAQSANQYKDTDVKYGVDTSQMPWRQEIVPLMLLSIPIDSLHCIASFLSASD